VVNDLENGINLSKDLIVFIKILSAIISTGAIIYSLVEFYKKRYKTSLFGISVFIPFIVLLSLSFTSHFTSKEEKKEYEERKKITFDRGELIITAIEAYYKKYNRYPEKINDIKKVFSTIDTTDAWGNQYEYSTDSIIYSVSFRLPGEKGYYFYNSSSTGLLKGYLFKYMSREMIR